MPPEQRHSGVSNELHSMQDEPTAKAPMLAAPLDPHDMNLGDEQRIDAEIDGAPPPVASTRSRRAQVFLGVSLVLLAFNLRPIFSSLGALLPEVIRSLHLSPSAASA